MQLNAQQQAAQRNLSYLLAEKIGQRILSGEYPSGSILPGNSNWVRSMASVVPPYVKR